MATTSIWAVKGWLGKVVVYAQNPVKTNNPRVFEKQGMSGEHLQGLSDVIDYAVATKKTLEVTHDETAPIMQRFVSAINCHLPIAREQMLATKEKFGKTGGVVAYHGYQSFAPGEVTPEIAHEIGKKLAQRLWGDRHEVVIATHLDKANHIHNHFVLNNVSMVDGKKYYRSKRDYLLMQQTSDALCREYRLSVIEQPQRGKAKQYGEWSAERDGRQTWRGLVKNDVDTAVRQSMTERQFWNNLKKMGYEIKTGKDISVRPPGKERFVRLRRNFGEDYTIEGIRRRILAQTRPVSVALDTMSARGAGSKTIHLVGTLHRTRRMTGLRALYFYYLYRLGVLPKKRKPNPKRVYFLFREDIRHIQNISREARLLAKHSIDTAEQLESYKASVSAKVTTLSARRKHLRGKMRSITGADELTALKSEIAALSQQIGESRREVRLCDDIEMRSGVMTDKLRRAREEEKATAKERKSHESFRGRR